MIAAKALADRLGVIGRYARPSQMAQLTALTDAMYLGYNRFSGSLPTEIGQLANLTLLDLTKKPLLVSWI